MKLTYDQIAGLRKSKLKLFRNGLSSQVFNHPYDHYKVLIFSSCPIIKTLCFMQNGIDGLPAIEKIGYSYRYDCYIYEQPKYRKFSKKELGIDSKKYDELFKILKSLIDKSNRDLDLEIAKLSKGSDFDSRLTKVLLESLSYWLCSILKYGGEFCLDIKPSNFALDQNNNLILLDLFYDKKKSDEKSFK